MRVLVIGGGAAGMMAAASAAEAGAEVIIFEKNEKLGKKLFITGKGRCNLTNACECEELFSNIISNPKFMYSAINAFDNRAVMDFFEKAGCKLKIERGNRVFPASDHSSDVILTLSNILKQKNVGIRLNSEITGLSVSEDNYITGVILKNGKKAEADSVIIATGGLSYKATGSTGDGFRFAEETGHRVTKLNPSLVPFECREEYCSTLMGLSLKNVSLKIMDDKKKLFEGFGEMLFTHFGISGPLVLSASSFYNKRKNDILKAFIDLKPALSEDVLDKRLIREFEVNGNKEFKNSLGALYPTKLIPVIIAISGIDQYKKTNSVTGKERRRLLEITKRFPLTITGTRSFDEAIITKGGISVKDINPSTMESKLIKGLFFAGEVIDVDALTGGFNLQIAWSTGFLAGENAARVTEERI
ncbi:MAG: NAD(P)/FAD-dependent oxidoreductase [Lachnospiraceae bacterium]|nr:NAD(P)/FAD-dependent oxidoreductase [Lachnospiraceae bacterium]